MVPPVVYKRREPEKTVVYRMVQKHYRTMVAGIEASGRGLPRFVTDEFEAFLGCGILARGFMRVRCKNCKFDRLVAFSCKKRGFCGSCIARRMADTAAHLADHVIPRIPMRQWVLTTPQPLRALLAYDPNLCARIARFFREAIFKFIQGRVRAEAQIQDVARTYPGAITATQRFNSAILTRDE